MVSILKFPHYLGLGTNAYDLILAVLNPPPLPILSLFLSFSFCKVASRSDLFYFFFVVLQLQEAIFVQSPCFVYCIFIYIGLVDWTWSVFGYPDRNMVAQRVGV